MDLHFPSSCSSPFTYLVSEHARAVIAIQELQREVNSLLSFRDHVLEALPHLQLRGATSAHQETAPRPTRPPSAPISGKSLSEGPSTVVDSGFSTDKASTSMGKSSSSSSGELSGGARWTCVEPEASGGAQPPLGSAEDELWQLLDVIQRKGSKLRKELERAEASEREYGHASDPLSSHSHHHLHIPNRIHPPSSSGRGPSLHVPEEEETLSNPLPVNLVDWWPHSLPGGAGPRFDYMPGGIEAWGELERLRQDRIYLMGRLSRAEAEATTTHQRLLDLHSQLVSLAGEKRRLEDAFRTLKIDGQNGDLNLGGLSPSNKVSIVAGSNNALYKGSNKPHFGPFSVTSVRIGEDVILPRVLKVPIRDRSDNAGNAVSRHTKPSRIPQGNNLSSPSKSSSDGSSTQILLPVKEDSPCPPSTSANTFEDPFTCTDPATLTPSNSPYARGGGAGSNRVVIERERNANRVDGGLSMPASLLKGVRLNVRPNKQRISAILKEKDVLALQRQLLTTVMETEVLRRQMEVAGEEWTGKLSEWETEKKKSLEIENVLKKENAFLKEQLDNRPRKTISNNNVGVWVTPIMRSVGVNTDSSDSEQAPTHSVHQGPNVKYDVVIYEEGTSSNENSPTSKEEDSTLSVEKPPRRTRPLSGSAPHHHQTVPSASNSLKGQVETSFGRDSLGRVAKIPLKPHRTPTPTNLVRPASSSTPTSTPRSSPASSISGSGRLGTGRPVSTSEINNRGSSTNSRHVARRDSMKVALSGPPSYISKGSGSSFAGTTKNGKNSGSSTVNNASKGVPYGEPHNSAGPPTPTHKNVLSNANGSIRRHTRNLRTPRKIEKVSSSENYNLRKALDPTRRMTNFKSAQQSEVVKERPTPLDFLEENCQQLNQRDSRHLPSSTQHWWGTQFPPFVGEKGSRPCNYIDGWAANPPPYLNGRGANYSYPNVHSQFGLWHPHQLRDSLENGLECVLQEDRTIGPILQEQLDGLSLTIHENMGVPYSISRCKEPNQTIGKENQEQLNRASVPLALGDKQLCQSHKAMRRTVSGALRIKNIDRPSVLPTETNRDPSFPVYAKSQLSPLVLRGALDDVNYRVEQILSQIAAKNATC